MNRPIRSLGIFLMLCFVALAAQLFNLQVVQAHRLNNDPRNNRHTLQDFSRNRGAILSADGGVLAQSVPSNDQFHYQREYPTKSLFAFVTGYQSFLFGTDGVENSYGAQLAGRDLRTPSDLSHLLARSQPTGNVTLTITSALQQAATAALGQRVGAVVALDPTTGAVLALVSQPSYDPNTLAVHDMSVVQDSWDSLNADSGRPLLARTYRESYAPGSTMKVLTMSAAFDHKPELASKSYPVTNALPLPHSDKLLHNFGGAACGGGLPSIFQFSCDTAFAQMGLDVGGPGMSAEAASFGFNQRPPLDLPSVAASKFPDAVSFVRNQPGIAYSAIGQQNVVASPLQMALIAGAIANHGTIMRPHVMASIADNDGRVVNTFKPTPWLQATSPQTADSVRQLMIDVVNGGTGTRAGLAGVQVAAKTGTAEVDASRTNAWMIAFAPADAPKIAVAVVLPGLTGVGNETTGGVVAAPVVRAVIAAFLGIRL